MFFFIDTAVKTSLATYLNEVLFYLRAKANHRASNREESEQIMHRNTKQNKKTKKLRGP
jgi:hypothetical protein